MPPPEQQLPEKDFIQDDRKKNPFPFLLWGCILTVFVCLMWGGWSWYGAFLNKQFNKNPFLQVTNRDFSIFLWQNPEFMRANVKNKSGYLPAFQSVERVGMDPAMAEEYIIAPPDVLFLYHTWKRLLSKEFIPRPIPVAEFRQFITFLNEWEPKFWPDAPPNYVKLVADLQNEKTQDLAALPETTLPIPVRMAFEGWKNYMKEGEAINAINPTKKEVQEFIAGHPHYARNYWRNILLESYPEYLKSLASSETKEESKVPGAQIAPFLRAALFNYLEAKKKQ